MLSSEVPKPRSEPVPNVPNIIPSPPAINDQNHQFSWSALFILSFTSPYKPPAAKPLPVKMPSSRMPKSMAEKKEVVQWIEKNGGVPTPAAVYFKNERGWKVSEAQVRYWWKQRTAIRPRQRYAAA
ncbi:unnamed protein product [Phytophthora lilii]|uniref:Unnamed protein product n=1 Tax=Phytophthora lilii TaxID=2077276 RepID=A0A9W6XGZ3_9STRA|nr:unnamed protein product [Phytophthora lilii]